MAANTLPGTLARVANATPAVLGAGVAPLVPPLTLDDDTRMLAAIANVLVRQQKARGYASISAFIKAD